MAGLVEIPHHEVSVSSMHSLMHYYLQIIHIILSLCVFLFNVKVMVIIIYFKLFLY